MKKLIIYLSIVSVLSSCSRMTTGCNRDFQSGSRNYKIEQYSGGKLVREWNFTGMLNNEEHSDGFYFYMNDSLVEISGDLIIQSK